MSGRRPLHLRRKRPKTVRCRRCKKKLAVPPRGRIPVFCSAACRQRAYEQRKHGRPAPVELFARDLATVKVRDVIRAIIIEELIKAGLLPPGTPPPTKPNPQRAHFKVIV